MSNPLAITVLRHISTDVSSDRFVGESTVSGNHATIPARIRRELGIHDGDRLRWYLEDDGSVQVEVSDRGTSTFAEFDGYDGAEATDVTDDHDAWGVDRE